MVNLISKCLVKANRNFNIPVQAKSEGVGKDNNYEHHSTVELQGRISLCSHTLPAVNCEEYVCIHRLLGSKWAGAKRLNSFDEGFEGTTSIDTCKHVWKTTDYTCIRMILHIYILLKEIIKLKYTNSFLNWNIFYWNINFDWLILIVINFKFYWLNMVGTCMSVWQNVALVPTQTLHNVPRKDNLKTAHWL